MNSFVGAIASPFATVGGTVRALAAVMVFGRGRGWGVFLSRTRIDYRSEIGDPSTNSVVGAVVGWVCRNFPQAPVRIVKAGTTEPAFQPGPTGPGALLRLLDRPNPHYSGTLQWRATLVDWMCRGNAYWVKVRSDGDRVIGLWWIPERMMEPKWPEDDPSVFIGWYEYTVDGVPYRIDPRNVVHFRNGIDPNNPRKGLSGLASLFREIFTDDEAANFSASLLRNLGVPGVVISPSQGGGPNLKADPEAVKTSFMEKFGGDKRGEPLVLTAPTDVKVLSFNPQQMELRELRRIPEERISANLGVPASVAGLGAGLDQNAFTSYGEARVAGYTEGIIPAQGLFAADIEIQLLPDFVDIEAVDVDVWFDWTMVSAMQAFAAAIWKQYESSATKGLITRATFKRATGQKVLPGDDVYIKPNNYVETPVGEPPPATPAIPQLAPGQRPPALPAGEDESPLLLAAVVATEVRCAGVLASGDPCGKLLAEVATPPYRITCRRCKTVAEADAPASVDAETEALSGLQAVIRSLAAPPIINVEAPPPPPPPIVHVEAPIVNVATAPFTEALAELRTDFLTALTSPRVVDRDADGRITGNHIETSIEEATSGQRAS